MPAPKLDFSDIFVGRSAELQQLKASLHAVQSSSNRQQRQQQHVFIEGASGSGKSKLVSEFRRKCCSKGKSSLLFGTAKLEQPDPTSVTMTTTSSAAPSSSSSSSPLLPVATALQEVIDQIIDRPEFSIKQLQESLEKVSLLDEWKILTKIGMISLGPLTDSNNNKQGEQQQQQQQQQVGLERLRFALRDLFKACCNIADCLVLHFDDLQWASRDTIVALKTLLQDSNLPVLFIFSHRPIPTTTTTSPDYYNPIEELKNHQSMQQKLELNLPSLDVQDVQSMLQKLLRKDGQSDSLDQLVGLILQKTSGNAFFVEQFLRLLESTNMIYYSMQTYQWTWDIERIQRETNISDNVVDLVIHKIKESRARPILVVLACLELTYFDRQLLCKAMTPHLLKQQDQEEPSVFVPTVVEELLEVAQNEGLIEKLPRDNYKIAHDKIQEASLAMLPSGEDRVKLHYEVGTALRNSLLSDVADAPIPTDDPRLLLLAADQLNAAQSVLKESDQLVLVKINYEAARFSMNRAVFFPAVDYLQGAISLLDASKKSWTAEYRDLTFNLHNDLSRALYSSGRNDESVRVADIVIKNAATFAEKDSAYHTKLLIFMQRESHQDTLDAAIEALRALGTPFPRRFFTFHMLRLFFGLKKRLGKMSPDDIRNLPEYKNRDFDRAIEYLLRLGECAFLWGMPEMMGLVVLISLEKTLDNGISGITASCLVGWGMILIEQGDIKEGYRWGKAGFEMARDLMVDPKQDYRGIGLYYTWIWHWQEPYQNGLAPFQNAMNNMWELGALEAVFMDSENMNRLYYCCGLKLGPLISDIQQFHQVMKDYQQDGVLKKESPLMQMVYNLAGQSVCTTELSGKFMSEGDHLKLAETTKNAIVLNNLHFYKTLLGLFFEDDSVVAGSVDKISLDFIDSVEPTTPLRIFIRGLASFVASQSLPRRRRSLCRTGRKVVKRLEGWVQAGNPNCHHMLLLIRAAQTSSDRNSDPQEVRRIYNEAIVAAGRLGFLHHKALASHLAGRYFANLAHYNKASEEFRSLTSDFMSQAVDTYVDWEAFGVVKHLQAKWESFLGPSSQDTMTNSNGVGRSSNHLGKSRLNNISKKHFKDKSDRMLDGREVLDDSQSSTSYYT